MRTRGESRPAPRRPPAYPGEVPYSAQEGRRELLEGLGEATRSLEHALAVLGAAYELLDEQTADRMEEELFGPTQRALGRAKRIAAAFGARSGLTPPQSEAQSAGLPSSGARGFIDEASDALAASGAALVELQDSPLLPEVGDPELREGLAELRRLVDDLPLRARELVRTLGR